MNMIPGKIVKANGSWRFVASDFTLELNNINFSSEREAIMGIRPEHIIISNDGIDCTISTVEPMGSVTYITVNIGSTILTVQYTGLARLGPNALIKIKFAMDKILFYDKGTGKLITE